MKQTKNKDEAPKSNKKSNAGRFIAALVVIVVLTSMAYTSFITTVGVGGKTNLYLSLPSMVTVLGILLVAVYQAAKNFK